jgi:hypothetical protein
MKGNSHRPIRATFFNRKKEPLKIVAGSHPASMRLWAWNHMQNNDYDAYTVDIHNIDTGFLYANHTWINGRKLETIFKADPTQPENQ